MCGSLRELLTKETKEIAYGILSQNNQVVFLLNFDGYYYINYALAKGVYNYFFNMFPVLTGKILDFSNADTAVDQYHRFKVKCRDKIRVLSSQAFVD